MLQSVASTTMESLALEQFRIERIAHHLANLQTPAFRPASLHVTSSTFVSALRQSAEQASRVPAAQPGPVEPGSLRSTGRALDVALAGAGYLEVATPIGPAYTRRGDLRIDVSGRLVDHAGRPVMGHAGEIVLSSGQEPRIDEAGRVFEFEGASEREVARLRVVEFDTTSARVASDGLVRATGEVGLVDASRVSVLQRRLESSKVDVAHEMLQLSRSLRHFETLLRLVQLRGELTGNAIRAFGGGAS